MALEHTLLGLLILYPRTGYDLHKRMESATFLLESASLRRIYPTLKRMASQGLLRYRIEPQEGRPDRKVYCVTERGEQAFLTWLREPVETDGDAFERFLAKYFFAGLLDRKTVLTQAHQALEERRRQLQQLLPLTPAPPVGPYPEHIDPDRVTAAWSRMLDYAQAHVRTQISWLECVLDAVADT